jgi:glycosyltransferase involved in cell wall biosynthesis
VRRLPPKFRIIHEVGFGFKIACCTSRYSYTDRSDYAVGGTPADFRRRGGRRRRRHGRARFHDPEGAMLFSVVINTYNRAASLRHTLESLRHQTYRDFEVLVVNGPSTDGTEALLAEYAGQVRALSCPVPRLAVSRNVGVEAAAGDVVAFIDDDSLATPTWLEELAEAFREPGTGAVGGLVYDPTGVKLQYRYAACHRNGVPVFKVEPPLDKYVKPLADPVAYLQGTNMAYSRHALREIGGFDEHIRHFYDDVDVCLRVIDKGYLLKQLDGAAVHHKFLASHIRDHKRMTLDPFNWMSDRLYFGLKHGGDRYPLADLMKEFVTEAERLRWEADHNKASGAMTQEQRDHVHRRVDEALKEGLTSGRPAWAGKPLPEADPQSFLRYPTRQPAGARLRIAFLVRDYPPCEVIGPARHTQELATGFAAAGHDVYVVTKSPDVHRVDQEAGVWVHRIPAPDRLVPELEGVASAAHIHYMTAAYHEVCKIHEARPLDLAVAPLWLCEGLVCSLDDRFATSVTLITAMKAVAQLADWARNSPEAQQLVKFEEEWVRECGVPHAISQAILERSVDDYGVDRKRAFVAPLGITDRREKYPRKRGDDGRVRVLYVGRLETRKGADVFLEAAARLGKEFPNAEFVLAGKELPTDQGDTHRQRFEKRFAADPDLRSRVTFAGMVTDDELYQHYADCDVFCLPTYYESFGQVYVEAMIWGKPIVGSRVGGVPEVVADGEQGYLCPVEDVPAVTVALRQLIANPALREKFGKRSRELFEEKWELSKVIARMAREFEGAVRRHRGEAKHAATEPPPRAEVAERFGGVLSRVTGISADAGRSAAARLLNPIHHPVDLTRQLARVWHEPVVPFVAGLYRVILDRHLGPGEERQWVAAVENGVGRAGLVSMLTGSDEFRKRGDCPLHELLTPDMLAHDTFHTPAAPVASPAPAMPTPVAPPPAPRPSLRHRLANLPLVGKLFKYARRLVVMPWHFHKVYQTYPDVLHVLRTLSDRQVAADAQLRELGTAQAALRGAVKPLYAKLNEVEEVARVTATAQIKADATLDRALAAVVQSNAAHERTLETLTALRTLDELAGRLAELSVRTSDLTVRSSELTDRMSDADRLIRELLTGQADLHAAQADLQALNRHQIAQMVNALRDVLGYLSPYIGDSSDPPAVVPMVSDLKETG